MANGDDLEVGLDIRLPQVLGQGLQDGVAVGAEGGIESIQLLEAPLQRAGGSTHNQLTHRSDGGSQLEHRWTGRA